MGSLSRFLANHPALNRASAQTYTKAVWGGIAQEFDRLKSNTDILTVSAKDYNNMTGDELDEIIKRFVGYDRLVGQSDDVHRRLVPMFLQRKGNISFQTRHAIRDVFSYFFAKDDIYVVENWMESSLILDGDFEAFDAEEKTVQFGEWFPSASGVAVDSSGSFEENRNLILTGAGTVYQDAVCASSGPYVLIVPHLGVGSVKVQRQSDGKYWNFSAMSWGASASLSLSKAGDKYAIREAFVVMEDADTVRITFSNVEPTGQFRLDFIHFGEKPSYPFIKVFVQTFGQGDGYINAWPGGPDPISGTDYENATFIGKDFIGGAGSGMPTSYYEQILDDIKCAGVKAEFAFLGRA